MHACTSLAPSVHAGPPARGAPPSEWRALPHTRTRERRLCHPHMARPVHVHVQPLQVRCSGSHKTSSPKTFWYIA